MDGFIPEKNNGCSFSTITLDNSTEEIPIPDLKNYSEYYSSPLNYIRLMHIAQISPVLRGRALKIAHELIISSLNITAYEQIFEIIRLSREQFSMNGQDATDEIKASRQIEDSIPYSQEWIKDTIGRCDRSREDLDAEIKNFKANTLKECTRTSYLDFGRLCMEMGDFDEALKYFMRSREYSGSWQQEVTSCVFSIKAALYLKRWSLAGSYVSFVQRCIEQNVPSAAANATTSTAASSSTATVSGDGSGDSSVHESRSTPTFPHVPLQTARTEICLAQALIDMAGGNYDAAITSFLEANLDPDEVTPQHPASLLTASDVAHCVTLCALACLDRSALNARILSNAAFRLLAELEAGCGAALSAFASADYATALRLVRSAIAPRLRADFFFADHVEPLCVLVRQQALKRYVAPFEVVDLVRMAGVFEVSVREVEEELVELMKRGEIRGLVDVEKKVMQVAKENVRCTTYTRAIGLIDAVLYRMQFAIVRANLLSRRSVEEAVERKT